MGILDDAKETAETAGRKIKEAWEDNVDRIQDKADEMKADAEVKKAEAEVKKAELDRDRVQERNELKEQLRDS